MELLRRHHWPGNVRELLHAIEAAAIVCEGSEIRPEHLPLAVCEAVTPLPSSPGGTERLPTLQEMRAHIERALKATGGHRGKAATILGISEPNLYRKLQEYRLLS